MIKNFLGLMLIVFGISLVSISAQTESKVKAVSKGVLNGSAVSLPKPPYPAAAQAVRADGAVNVEVLVDENGDVISAKAVSGHPLLRQASEKAARAAKFTPTVLSGEAVKITGVLVYNFGSTVIKGDGDVPVGDPTVTGATTGSEKFGKVLNGSAINLPKPAYPPAAQAVRASGAVSVQVLVDEAGNVVSATAVSGHPLLRQSAVDAALLAKFEPTLLEGSPVKVNGIVIYNFVP